MKYTRIVALFALVLVPCSPVWAQFTTVLNVPPDAAPTEIESDTQLNLSDGGALPDQFNAGVNPANNTNVEVNVLGGTVGVGFRANGGSHVEISGGLVGNNFFARNGSAVDVHGGTFDGIITARGGSVVNIMGGAYGDKMTTDSGAVVNFFGNEMRLDGELIDGLANNGDSIPFNLQNNSVLSGVLADGTPFAFTRRDSDVFQLNTLTLHTVELPAIGPAQITASADPIPLGIRAGQTLTVDAGAVVENQFNAGVGSQVIVDQGSIGNNLETSGMVTLNSGTIGNHADAFGGSHFVINGGNVGTFFQAYGGGVVDINGGSTGSFLVAQTGSEVNVSGGTLGSRSEAESGATVNMTDGTIGQQFDANSGSRVSMSGGNLGADFNANSGSTVDVSGGLVQAGFEAFNQSDVNISGGTFRQGFHALAGSNINITGKEFLLDDAPIPGLVANDPFLVTDRNVTLSGIFADGLGFDFQLNAGLLNGQDLFQSQANLTLILLANADFDANAVVDEDDLAEWEAAYAVNSDADADFDGDSDGADFMEWQRQLGDVATTQAAIASVPEPSTTWLLVAAVGGMALRRRRAA